MSDNKTGIDVLREPIQPDEIEWRIAAYNSSNKKCTIVPYIDNRCVMERFDRAFGWDNWNSNIQYTPEGFICSITVTGGDGKTVTKTDGAPKTDIESFKGGISDSMKRCAVQFGLGRCLYEYPMVRFASEEKPKYIPNTLFPRLSAMVSQINSGQFNKPLVDF